MKVFTAQQIREADAYTIANEPVSSIDLMERAASQCASWIGQHFGKDYAFYIFCGPGNNGGDGLAISRLLQGKGYHASAYLILSSDRLSPDCKANLKRLEHAFASRLFAIHDIGDFPELPENAVLVDALFGTGINRPLEGLSRAVVERINQQSGLHPVVSIDMPSGLIADGSSAKATVIRADHTLSFEFYKLAFLFAENGAITGEVHILPIGISKQYVEQKATPYYITDEAFIRSIYRKRSPFSHKGTYGHALIMAGSYGKIGAALLSTKACLHAGAGLVTSCIPACGYLVLQTGVPEAMCICDPSENALSYLPDGINDYQAIGLGPGIGGRDETLQMLRELLIKRQGPLVLDADALNLIAREKMFEQIPPGSVLTPHPKEFERLFGKAGNDFERLALQIKMSEQWNIYIVLKGHYSAVSTPEGSCFFNTTGNAGMASGGSGDVLTGIITGLMAQGYHSFHAAILGVYLHGLAGDLAAAEHSMESLSATDIIAAMGQAFLNISAS